MNRQMPVGRSRSWQDAWPRGDQRVVIALIAIFWFAFQCVYFAYFVLGRENEHVSPADFGARLAKFIILPSEMTIVGTGALLSLGIYAALHAVRRMSLWKQLALAGAIASLAALIFSLAICWICDFYGVPWPDPTARFVAADTLRWVAPFGLWAGIALSVTYNGEMRDRERRLAALQAREQEAQMRALRYQVNPHLLYNTLNSIAALILDGKNDLAESMVIRLANFFRASLASDPHSDLPLDEELALQRTYLEIEQMRFPRLRVSFDIADDAGRALVPGLILQPLIENVLKHGINPDGQATHLAIRARREGDLLVIEVADNGPGLSAHTGTGVGLQNVRSRLEGRFGSGADVYRDASSLGGHLVRLRLPWRQS